MLFFVRDSCLFYLIFVFFSWGWEGWNLLLFVQHTFIHTIFGGNVSLGRCAFFVFGQQQVTR